MRRWAIAALLAAAACAGGCSPPGERPSEAPQPTAPTSTSVAPSTDHGSLAQCLAQHGVPAPPGPATGPPPGVDPANWEKAMAECSTLAPGPVGP
ncbi:MAG: hypothetical protein K0U84_11240 [Actinomycetia bacterium]|nr:hypothetical protein [Actinomycetes bacterium]